MNYGLLFSNLKKVNSECFSLFNPFYIARSNAYQYPTFYQTILELICRGCFWYKIENDILLIFKRKNIMGNGTIFLQIAPISLKGDVKKEVDYLKMCFEYGIKAKLNMEDIRRYRLPSNLYEKDGLNSEYIYSGREFLEMKGGKFTKIRNRIRKFEKENGFFETGYSNEIEILEREWSEYKKNGTQNKLLATVIANKNNNKIKINRIYSNVDKKHLEGFSVTERISKNAVIITQRLRNYNSFVHDVNPIIQLGDFLQYKCEIKDRDIYFNMGMAGNIPGLAESKDGLRPIWKMQIYKTVPKKKFTKQDYELTKKYFNENRSSKTVSNKDKHGEPATNKG